MQSGRFLFAGRGAALSDGAPGAGALALRERLRRNGDVGRAPQYRRVQRNERNAQHPRAYDELRVVGGQPAFQRRIQDGLAVNGVDAVAERGEGVGVRFHRLV